MDRRYLKVKLKGLLDVMNFESVLIPLPVAK